MRATALAVALLALPVAAQDEPSTFLRALELPAHRSLMAKIRGANLAPFESDGCSGGLSTSWRVVADLFPDFADMHDDAPPWEDCCVIHDRAYHDAGGAADAEASFEARLGADAALRACVIAKGQTRREELAERYNVAPDTIDRAYLAVAEAMYNAVRFGGQPCLNLPWRWGFGYPKCVAGF
ncbi:ATP-binding protein [Defluviimonas sp. WL0024]|uniref:ATP-binding protein n=2 Tax=Albidovulum TaxID=205889 RepID=A0ABT3J703_9RHOB|nr:MULTISPECIES: ATP-binding protein [Defluviimonas]MCU9850078.1 ATP-binding protein [Defluviimonas sp. WL0024]MCW3783447.1 ATP-binding protein [Defluviimonas salinarum]